ncbi:MAG: MarR family transcriptional regulator [Massilibacteroides sp.]|nr:MarR family transcriptional regulator [Massilibacteroides sp.]MDD3062835.1 MarR family transcriptional regulator [Massilibacteroides sp.]MDD4116374.1 MarR family transcriptional regulator [Massilibacteroides sp.]MDD4659415.1 MarR family transcriptional regulator [Massilibacteroides sp.]
MRIDNALCSLRDIYRAIREFEIKFSQKHDLCLNEGMLLCTLCSEMYSSSEIASLLGLTNSNASKVIRSVEEKGFIERRLGQEDKRQMYFVLSSKGQKKLKEIKEADAEIRDVLLQIIEKKPDR